MIFTWSPLNIRGSQRRRVFEEKETFERARVAVLSTIIAFSTDDFEGTTTTRDDDDDDDRLFCY